jgi:hypothetical protein
VGDASARPGGRWKYGFSQWMARRLEPETVRASAHAICVSPAYPEFLRHRYPDVPASRLSVLPFPATERDFEIARDVSVQQSIFDPHDGRQHWVYAGRGQADMAKSLRGIFIALSRAAQSDPSLRDRLTLHFVGTSYASGERAIKTIEPIAQEFGVSDLVSEHPLRIPYFEALKCMIESNALILFGSDDPSYNASKLAPCLFARKPLLAVFHEQSPVISTLRDLAAGTLVTFGETTSPEDLGATILEQWFNRGPSSAVVPMEDALEPYTSRYMTVRLVEVFDRAVESHKPALAFRAD